MKEVTITNTIPIPEVGDKVEVGLKTKDRSGVCTILSIYSESDNGYVELDNISNSLFTSLGIYDLIWNHNKLMWEDRLIAGAKWTPKYKMIDLQDPNEIAGFIMYSSTFRNPGIWNSEDEE